MTVLPDWKLAEVRNSAYKEMQRTKTALFAYVGCGARKATYIIVEQVGLFVQLLVLLEDLLRFSFQLRHSLHSHMAELPVD